MKIRDVQLINGIVFLCFDVLLFLAMGAHEILYFYLMRFSILIFFYTLTACNTGESLKFAYTDIQFLDTPCTHGGEPNLFCSADNEVYLSWIKYENDSTDIFQYSSLENQSWSAPKEIARGNDWFVNWADFPSLQSFADNGNNLAAHWLQKSAKGTYDYDVRISQSGDGGETWRPSFVIHQDGIEAEHGFVSMLPIEHKIFTTWLDGRYTKHEEGQGDSHRHQGSMTLRCASFDKSGQISDEHELDDRVCDCCQTSVAKTDRGLIVAYRDRSQKEIRDISVVSQIDGDWSEPQTVYNDNWKIAGCPVNGPVVRAIDNAVCVVWHTASNAQPQVKLAFSYDSGLNFDLPIIIDDNDPIGRVDLAMITKEKAIVSWLGQSKEKAIIYYRTVNADKAKGEVQVLTETDASRTSGFPQMIKNDHGQLIFAWTAVQGDSTLIRSAIVSE